MSCVLLAGSAKYHWPSLLSRKAADMSQFVVCLEAAET